MRTNSLKSSLVWLVTVLMVGVLVNFTGIVGAAAQAGPDSRVMPGNSNECTRYTTGFTVCGRFLEYWLQNGNLAQQGYPISEPRLEVSKTNGKTYTVQYFERAVFELHPENQRPYDVLLSLLGRQALNGQGGSVGACFACPTTATTYADPINPDDNVSVPLKAGQLYDVEVTVGPGTGENKVHTFVLIYAFGGETGKYADSHMRYWEVLPGVSYEQALLGVKCEAENFANERRGESGWLIKFGPKELLNTR